MEKQRRKTRWSFHSFNIGDKKRFHAIDMPKFRSSLSTWNKQNPDNKINYDYQQSGNNIIVERIA